MIYIFLSIILASLIVILVKNKVSIDFPSFFKKGFKARRGKYGVYCFCGKQGSGKTFSTVNFLLRNKDKKIYSNISLKGLNYIYFKGFEEMLNIKDKNCIIVFDEIFSALSKSSKITPEVLSFLSQQRKKEIIFITTAQEWLEIPITLRRYVRYQIDCSIFNLFPFSILIEKYHDGEQIHWDNLANDYVAPVIATKISKMKVKITEMYDTFEVIGGVPKTADGGGTPPEESRERAPAKRLAHSRFFLGVSAPKHAVL